MGNRAVVIEFGKKEGVYLHWNGGRDSVYPMLYYAKNFLTETSSLLESNLKKFEFIAFCLGLNPEYSDNYNELDCDNYDNGVYVINKDFKIISRMFMNYEEQDNYNFVDFLIFIDENMPKKLQKGKDYIFKYLSCDDVEKTKIYSNGCYEEVISYDDVQNRLEVGDIIFYRGEFREIIGKNNESEKMIVSGNDVSQSAFFNYTELYEDDSEFKLNSIKDIEKIRNNPNSYMHYHYENKEDNPRFKVLVDNNFKIVNKEKLNDYIVEYKLRNKE